MAENDYICVYRQFFEEFAKTSQMQDCMPMRVNPYNLSVDELVGEVMQSCVNYLIERKCPRSLVVPLTKIVVEEFINEAKKQPEEVSNPLELNRRTHCKISEVCLRYTDNEKLSNLPSPVKETYYSTHSTKHTRRRMEDRLICLPRFNTLHSIENSSEAGYYGIFDGHSGVTAACYAVSHMHQFLAESEYYPADPVQAFRQAFEKTELKYNSKDGNCGTAALAILHQQLEKKLTVAWVGDSQAMLVSEDSYVMLVDPHKPERTDERKRIEELGGCLINIQSIFRVNGLLAISRAIGDKKLKPYISAEPEIRAINLTGSEHFIVMGCDGLWDVVEPHQVIETVYFEVQKNEGQIDSVARRLVDLAKENNSTDNISVIVIFLTDPTEIKNRSVDVSGHRPKILHQDGVIMEANFQTNDTKSPFGDPGMNGLHETNGNHFDIQNGSDEDFGPETDVDAVDDIMTSPKTLNPFSKENWQKTGEENSEKLIEFRQETKALGDEFVNFSEEFAESVKPVVDNNSSQFFDVKSEKFHPMDIQSEISAFSCNFSEENNKYVDDINSRKEELDTVHPTLENNPFELKNEAGFLDESQNKNGGSTDFYDFGNNNTAQELAVPSTETIQNLDFFSNEDSVSLKEEKVKEIPVEPSAEEDLVQDFNEEFIIKESQSNENSVPQTNEMNVTTTKIQDFRDLTSGTTEGAMDLIEQNIPVDDSEMFPELCTVVDTVEAAKVSQNICPMEDDSNKKDGNESSSDLFSPTAPILDGETKDDIVAELGGEVEDSEDDEWNYIKVESGNNQTITIDSKASELVSFPSELSASEVPKMNSPLNPEADEFIPVSAKANDSEFHLNITPKKAIPEGLTDIISSSPNWNNMNNVSVPEEEAFLKEIKSRPSNIFENIESPEQENFEEKIVDLNNSLDSPTTVAIEKVNEFVPVSTEEPHGINLASDMTSSFIDPSTISSEIETVKEEPNLISPVEEKIEKTDVVLNESFVKATEESGEAEVPSKLPDLLSPVPVQENISTVDVVKPNETETQVLQVSEPVTSNSFESPESKAEEDKPVETNQIILSASNEPALSPLQASPEEPTIEEKPKEEVLSNATDIAACVGAVTAVATAGTLAAAKKDTKKPSPKTMSSATSKAPASSKPVVNGTKTSAPAKKPTPMARTPLPGKTLGTTTTGSAAKTAPTKPSVTMKAQPKSTVTSSTLTKTTARPRLTSATPTAAKGSASPKTAVTTSPIKSSLTTSRTVSKVLGSAPAALTQKPKPRVSSDVVEKKTTSSVDGDTKTLVKRTEVITKKPGGTSTTITATTTRFSTSARPATAPSKTTTVKTTVTTTRTVTAKPRTTVSSAPAMSTPSPTSKTATMTRRSTTGAEKQAKEVANRLTSKTGLASKATPATALKSRKTMTTTTTSKTKNHDKTEVKAEKILEIEVTRSENGIPSIEKTTEINLINSVISEQTA